MSKGTAHVLVTGFVLAELLRVPEYGAQVLEAKDHGEGLYQVLVESDRLAEGYNGQQCVILAPVHKANFARDLDT